MAKTQPIQRLDAAKSFIAMSANVPNLVLKNSTKVYNQNFSTEKQLCGQWQLKKRKDT